MILASAHSLNLALLAPLIVIELVLLIVCLVDLARRERVLGGNKLVWLLIILVLGIIGQVAYLVVGRGEG